MFEDNNVIRENDRGVEAYITRVFMTMFFGLLVTAFTSYYLIQSGTIAIFANGASLIALIIGELALVWYLSAKIQDMSLTGAKIGFYIYAILNGITLSFIVMQYTGTTVTAAFAVTAGTFGAMAIYGYVTKTDLTRFGSLFIMLLIGVIIATLVNMFLRSSGFDLVLTYLGILIFLGLTAYDTQRIKEFYYENGASQESANKMAIMGALALYLDFINLFIRILRIFGRGRD